MSIRLNKVAKNLNVGVSTLVDFLRAKGVNVENNPNTKVTQDEYNILLKEFNQDKSLKMEAERIQERSSKQKPVVEKKEEARVEEKHTTVVEEEKKEEIKKAETETPVEKVKAAPVKEEVKKNEIGLKQVGKIDLAKFNRPKIKNKVEHNNVASSGAKGREKLSGNNKKEEHTPKDERKFFKKEAEGKKQEGEFKSNEVKSKEMQKPANPDSEKKEEKIFTLGSGKIESNIVLKGKIDLSSINQATRPRKKTQAEKKKERGEKMQQARVQREQNAARHKNNDANNAQKPSDGNDIRKKKRSRIKDGKVRVNEFGNNNNAKPTGQQNNNRHKKKKLKFKQEVSAEDVSNQIKETLARLTAKPKKGTKYRKEKREEFSRRKAAEERQEEADSKVIKITEFVTVNDLANMMDVPVVKVISVCMNIGQMVSINQRLDAETINFVADEFGYKTDYVSATVMEAIEEEEDQDEDLVPRAPIVTVMGHVDHGKTSLLDYIRKTNVIAGEAGGITQHIGAYNVTLSSGKKMTFLDTPGHEAFTAMRARGAQVTDIAIIIVAADDDVMPQTVEAVNHASAAEVPIVFAINKIDKPGADPERVKGSLAKMNYLVEDWGGKYQSEDISAKKGLHVKELLEKVLLEAEMLNLKANPSKNAVGTIIESSLDKGRGYVATILVRNGTLKVGDFVVAGTSYGRIKAMFNERGQNIEKAAPAEPALILGLNGAPQAGDKFHVMDSEQEAKAIANKREQLQREQGLRTSKTLTLDEIGRRIAVGDFQELNIIVKGDVDGSVEALSDSLIKLSTDVIQVNIIHKAVGAISESDVTLAAASNAIIVGFQIRPSQAAKRLAEKEGVDMRIYSIIYDAIEEIRSAMEGMLSPEVKEKATATLEVREVFKISKVGTVSGCFVKEGKLKRGNKLHLIRDGIVKYTGEMGALKHFKDDVKEVQSGMECGLSFANYQDIKVGDIIESFEEIEVQKTL